MTPVVELTLDHPRIGCGRRVYVVLRVGRRWAELLYPPTLTAVTVPLATYERAARAGREADPARVRKIIAHRRRVWRALDRRVSRAVRRALALLRAPTPARGAAP